ncbi:MAG TPA: Hsp20/alpha crystallin family protein [Candidatus Udaeobacter sp.]|nr:Hsp20/alpha crystallin family protein [Candidatus Udaeobacter sp.]
MPDNASKVPVKSEKTSAAPMHMTAAWQPFEALQGQIDRVFENFSRGFPFGSRLLDLAPLRRRALDFDLPSPAVDVSEKDGVYEISVELPGMNESNIEVKVADDVLTIKGEKKEEREEKDKNYYMSERRYGSFQRSFQLPAGVDQSKIDATFQKGVLTVTLPKSPEAQKKEKKIAVKAK